MDHDTLALIERAVQGKRVCRASFEEEEGTRIVHPYGIFRTKKGIFMLACWQEGSYNELQDKPLTPGFRNFPLNSCEWIEVIDRIFLVNRQFNPEANIYNEWVYHV